MNNNQKKKKGGFPWGLIAVFIIAMFQFAREGSHSSAAIAGVLFMLMIGFIFVGIAVTAARHAAARKQEEAATPRVNRNYTAQQPSVELNRPVVSAQRPSPAAQRSFPQPDAHCVVCDNTGEDHFVRDRRRRIAQLDEWLKNGLVDKNEYRVLKYRFERDQ